MIRKARSVHMLDLCVPFVVPMATTSLFAQSKVQQAVSSSSIRRIGRDNLTIHRLE